MQHKSSEWAGLHWSIRRDLQVWFEYLFQGPGIKYSTPLIRTVSGTGERWSCRCRQDPGTSLRCGTFIKPGWVMAKEEVQPRLQWWRLLGRRIGRGQVPGVLPSGGSFSGGRCKGGETSHVPLHTLWLVTQQNTLLRRAPVLSSSPRPSLLDFLMLPEICLYSFFTLALEMCIICSHQCYI